MTEPRVVLGFSVVPVPAPNAPGWMIESRASRYQLWAPREGRPFWSASWDRKGGLVGRSGHGVTMQEAILAANPPTDAECRAAYHALKNAGALHDASTRAEGKDQS